MRPSQRATVAPPAPATPAGSHSPSDAVEWQCRSMCGVIGLGRGPRRLRLAEQLEQLTVRQLREGTVGRPRAERRVMGDAPAALRSRALLEDEAELISAVYRHAAGGKDLPPIIVYHQEAAGHGPLRL